MSANPPNPTAPPVQTSLPWASASELLPGYCQIPQPPPRHWFKTAAVVCLLTLVPIVTNVFMVTMAVGRNSGAAQSSAPERFSPAAALIAFVTGTVSAIYVYDRDNPGRFSLRRALTTSGLLIVYAAALIILALVVMWLIASVRDALTAS